MDLKRYEQLKGQVDRLQRDHDRAEGALSGLMARLKAEHGCDTLEEAQAKLKQLEAKAEKAEKQFEEALEQFEEEWAEKLEA